MGSRSSLWAAGTHYGQQELTTGSDNNDRQQQQRDLPLIRAARHRPPAACRLPMLGHHVLLATGQRHLTVAGCRLLHTAHRSPRATRQPAPPDDTRPRALAARLTSLAVQATAQAVPFTTVIQFQ